MPSKKKIAKSLIKMVEKNDPQSSVTDAEYKASMKKLKANKRKNDKEARKSNY
jgi:hypothetical protein